jgi:GABA permease
MESPFRSEDAAFRFLLITIGAFALIVGASWLNRWLGLLVTLALSSVALWVYVRQRPPKPSRAQLAHVGPLDVHRVLVVANETVGGEELMGALGELALEHSAEFYVICPALNSRLRTWTSDEDPARAAAQERLDQTLARLAEIGVESRGEVGDGDPLVAVEDGVRLFSPDEIVVSTHPPGRSNWLERGVVDALRERYACSVRHVVVDLARANLAEEAESR